MTFKRSNIFLGIASIVGVLVLTIFAGWWQIDGPGGSTEQTLSSNIPLPLYEMNFELVSHSGQKAEPQDWVGRPTLIFFGFTYCPDVCPTTLSNISSWLEEIGDEASQIHVAFITVDPERDTNENLADYVSNFHPSIIGYTGRPTDIARAVKGFHAEYEKVETGDDYTMNHTASVFIYDDEGRFVSMSDFHEPREYTIKKIRRALRSSLVSIAQPSSNFSDEKKDYN